MQQGSFYCFVPRKSPVSSWLPFSKAVQKVLQKRFDELLNGSGLPARREEEGGLDEEEGGGRRGLRGHRSTRSELSDLGGHNSNQDTQIFYLPGGGASVRYGFHEITGNLSRVHPHVYRDGRAITIFCGHLSNVDDLLLHIGAPSEAALRATDAGYADEASSGTSNVDFGTLASRVLTCMFLDHRDKDPLWVLSELQGQYAFVIYDGTTKQAFAARDLSGKLPLYYHLDPEQGVSFTNCPIDIPDAHDEAEWLEVPPGHFVAGKTPRLQQFALTPEQLKAKKSRDFGDSSVDEDWWLSSGSPSTHGGLFSSLSRQFSRRRSSQLDGQWDPETV